MSNPERYKVGQWVIVRPVQRISGHQFDWFVFVELIEWNENDSTFLCKDNKGEKWCLYENELMPESEIKVYAAAPEMYEVLKKIRDIADLSTSLEMAVYGLIDICDEIDQALAKARGEVNQPNEQP